jgi:GNAT superfamily N-acetyltransferase
MSDKSDRFEITRLETGDTYLNEDLINRLLELWQDVFQTDYSNFRSILKGHESGINRDILIFSEKGGKIAGTCHLTQSLDNPELGGLGEVCTIPEYRGMGIAGNLCKIALDEFRSAGGKALFLGTANPAAALIYSRLGWHKLPAANVMANILGDESPEEFLTGYFVENNHIRFVNGSPAQRIAMIPLIVLPHDWLIMDAILDIYSTRYVLQRSCMGLYPRYEKLRADGNGSWFAAKNDYNQTVGLSSARIDVLKRCQVDGFIHYKYKFLWEDLIKEAILWAADQNARACWARLSVEDEEKISMFEASSFKKRSKGTPFDLDGREIAAICMEIRV